MVIIGSGAGGGTLAHELTRRGIKVVLLEAGARQSLASFSQVPGEAFAQLTWLEPRTQSGTSTVAKDYPTLPSWTCKTVGGTTVHWTGATPRIRPWEVRVAHHLRRHRGRLADRLAHGVRRTGALLPDLAEKRMVVTRRNGNPGLPASNHFKVMYNGAKRIGYKRVHTSYMAINTRAADDRGVCIQQGFCVQGCKTGAKWSTLYTEIPRAEATGNLDLRIRVPRRAHRARRRRPRRPAWCTGTQQGKEQRQKARIVCVACNAVETARLLLLSESAKFPTRSRELAATRSAAITATTPAASSGASSTSRSTSGAARRWPASSRTRPGTIRSAASSAAIIWSWPRSTCRALPLAGLADTMWGRDLAFVMDHYRNMAGMFINGEDLPRATNRITLNPKVKDAVRTAGRQHPRRRS